MVGGRAPRWRGRSRSAGLFGRTKQGLRNLAEFANGHVGEIAHQEAHANSRFRCFDSFGIKYLENPGGDQESGHEGHSAGKVGDKNPPEETIYTP